jgi:hypothetical protein
LLFPDLIKILIIEDGVLKINKLNGAIKEFEISEIRKIHIINRNNNPKILNLIVIIAVLLSIYFMDNLNTLLWLIIIFTCIAAIFVIFEKNKPKILYIKFNNKSTYSVKFNSEIKDLVLKVIWEIRNINKI